MAAFYVGQRVRIVRCYRFFEFLGKEATVTGGPVDGFDHGKAYTGYLLNVDGLGELTPDGRRICNSSDQLEPIVPPGMESLEETLALWQPESVAA